jgi:hypothetical protein
VSASDEARVRFFTQEVKPVLQEKCVACHSGEKPQGGLRLTSREAVLKGGNSGPAVSLQTPGDSLLVKAVNYQGRRMPPQGKLGQAQIDALTRWASMGLPWPAGEQAGLEPKTHAGPPPVTPETMKFWSFQPVRRPQPPEVKGRGWVRNPIDAFILKRLEAAGLAPNPPAGKTSLIRRAYYDLTGLPPSPEEVQAFLADKSPHAWETVIDRLLASPQYGEKWGRHWLDLVRFAESNSYERDAAKPNAWRYRDYVIKSFNEDKPYDQFVQEQLAGDEQTPRTPERLIATGYYRLGIWDDEPADHDQALYDDLDDIAGTTGQVFLGLTVGCARCHDHKLDPIPQKDYYRFLSFFAGVRRYGGDASVEQSSLRELTPTADMPQEVERYAAYKASVKVNDEQIAGIEEKILPDLAPVEKEEWRNEATRAAIVKKRVPRLLSEEELARYVSLSAERQSLRRLQQMALCVTEVGPTPRETHVLMRGNPHVPGDRVEPGFLSVLAPPPPEITPPPYGDTCGRRLALARWIGSKENPLTARVLVNRVWQYHFGHGIVRSANNFGFQGDKPTHPELLDWLASYFVAGSGGSGLGSGAGEQSAIGRRQSAGGPPEPLNTQHPTPNAWSLKALHKLIMMSAAYQMSSQANPAALKKDPENDLFWRFDMRRLQAEELRDSILAVNGSLSLKAGGPGFYPTISAEVLAGQSVPGANWGKSSPEEQSRRSVYIFVKRSLVTPMIASFDGPETDFTCPARFSTTQPTQALGMINSAFVNEQAKLFAQYLRKQAGDSPAEQVRLCLTRVLQRKPSPAEVTRGVKLIETLRRDEAASADQGLATFCLVALNLNEFIYLD